MSSTAVKINGDLASEAREAANISDRSLTGQIEHWARLGMAMEPHMNSSTISALKQSGGELTSVEDPKVRERLFTILEGFRTQSRNDLRAALGFTEKVRIEPDPDKRGHFLRIHPDGQREAGTVQGREFIPEGAIQL